MKKIFIVGGDGFARECYVLLKTFSNYNKEFTFGGFLGHGGYGHTVNYKTYQYLYIGEVSEYTFNENDYVVIGAGYPNLRKKIYTELKERNVKFYNLISSSSLISNSVEVGEANIILASSCTANINIGNGNVFNGDVIVGHDVEIGDFNFFGPRSQILGNVKVGNSNQVGANTILLPKSKIGDNNIIAPLSAIYKGCKNNCYMSGNPALKTGQVE